MDRNWSKTFSFLTAAVLAQLPLLPTRANPAAFRASAAQSPSFQTANGYPIARQVFVGDREILQPQDIRPLPGGLDSTPVFNSNSPEAIRQSGILLSTFPPQGKLSPNAHLGHALQGRFDVFAHHIAKTDKPDTTPTLYNGILIYNPNPTQPVIVNVLKAGSFLGNPEAPYIGLPPFLENPFGRVFSGPGGRLTDALLRNNRLPSWPSRIDLLPKQSQMLMNLPIPVPRPGLSRLMSSPLMSRNRLPASLRRRSSLNLMPINAASSSNTRSTMLQLYSSGPVYMAYLAMYAPITPSRTERVPQKSDWENLVINGKLAEPRDRPPSVTDNGTDKFFYGRVSGISRGSQWQAKVTDTPRSKRLTIPVAGEAFSYGLSTLPRGTFGTGQVQSAPMLVRYPDTAWLSHGNYGVHYQVSLPLYNPTDAPKQVAVVVQTPIKRDVWGNGLQFLRALPDQVFFRGTIRVRYQDDDNIPQLRYYHLNQRQGQQGEPLALITLGKKENRTISLDYMYPPDATPPQVLTIQTLAATSSNQRSAYGIQP
ncbi:DUF3370 domain-containing protein [Altericista sp. CCNU0014]|uniref:DUF3370 domain-containing protein n=1 Tax=Altericista sp. CCNU0014 TaxID=3082949 RepID=UPI00384E7AEF